MQWNLTSILIMLGVLFLGYGIGLFEMHLKRQKKIAELEAALKMEQAQAAPVTGPPPAPAPIPSNLRLWTDANGTLKLELDNEPLHTPAAATPEHRRRLITLLTQLRPWVDSGPAAPRPAAASIPPLQKGKAGVEEARPAPALKSIVEQIDDVLQAKLPDSPFKNHALRLTEGPGGVVLVRDGAKKYEGIDAVPDPEIQAFIRQVVAEWEKSSK